MTRFVAVALVTAIVLGAGPAVAADSPLGTCYKGGTITDPEDGKVYNSELWLEGDTLKVRGYLDIFHRRRRG